ncbi:MAG: glycosyltransferase [Lachnospiraceae bacterium]|nr:glycosyltransferase [Lachnospiraceae bacterium]
MKILYIDGYQKEKAGVDIVQALREMGHDAQIYSDEPMIVTVLQEAVVKELKDYICAHEVQLLVSIHFIMCAELAAWQLGLPYISILWDAPYTEIYNPLGKMENVWVSTFDRLDRDRMLAAGIQHVLYQPLSVNAKEITEWNREIQETLKGNYIHDITMVGSLYDKNLYDRQQELIPAALQPYFNSIFEEAAFRWDGIDRVYGKTGAEILQYIKMASPEFCVPNKQDIEDVRVFEIYYLIRKIANIERIAVLNLLAEKHSVKLYTTSEAARTKLLNVEVGPAVLYGKATSLVYAGSKINLNITLKGIEGGTPLRIMDIMAAGGFVLTSYCAETAELFEEDREIVMFRSPEELLEKVDYYLAHDRERRQIAEAGLKKVMRCYTYEKKMRELLDWMAESIG